WGGEAGGGGGGGAGRPGRGGRISKGAGGGGWSPMGGGPPPRRPPRLLARRASAVMEHKPHREIACRCDNRPPLPEEEKYPYPRTEDSTMDRRTFLGILVSGLLAAMPSPVVAVEPGMVDRESEAALKALYESTPEAKDLAARAKGILVFPNIVKAGFIFGAQYGDGELLKDGRPAGYYNITAVSYGLQAGIQAFGYAMFFMTDSALTYLDRSAGFEIGVVPRIVVVYHG